MDNSGPAFPEPGLSGLPNGEFFYGQSGMSRRDYFAIHISDIEHGDVVQIAGLGFDRMNQYVYTAEDSTVGIPFGVWWESLSFQRRCELRAKARYALADAMLQAAHETLLSQEKAK